MWTQVWPLVLGLGICLLLLLASLHDSSNPASQRPSKAAQSFAVQREREDLQRSGDLNYGVIVDAGSSGSRGFVYVWPPHSGDPHALLRIEPLTDDAGYPVLKKISPGLSSMADNPKNASDYMAPLLDFAASKIPVDKHKQTSLFILATAGLRLIPDEQREAILTNLRKELPLRYSFIVMEQHIQMISGKWEGIYSWIAVNYALGKLSAPQLPNATVPSTVGMIDMGGGSVQIAFQMMNPLPPELGHLGQTINLGCQEHDTEHEFRLYVSTFLGFGANSAMERYENSLYTQALAKRRLRRQAEDNSSLPLLPAPPSNLPSTREVGNRTELPGPADAIPDPCLPLNMVATLRPSTTSATAEMPERSLTRRGTGDFQLCMERVKALLNQDKECEEDPCTMDGRHQPPIRFDAMQFYGFSEYWYSSNDVVAMGSRWNLDEFVRRQADFCDDRWSLTKDRFHRKLYPKADLMRIKTQCFKGAWIAAVLHSGFGFPRAEPRFKPVQTIRGQEIQWTLGAILYKLRYFPLREIQRLRDMETFDHQHGGDHNLSRGLLPSSTLGRLVLLFCGIALVGISLRYWWLTQSSSAWSNRLPRSASLTFPPSKGIWGFMGRSEDMRRSSSANNLLTGLTVAGKDYVY